MTDGDGMCCMPMSILEGGHFFVKLYVAGALVGSLVAGLIVVELDTGDSLTAESAAALCEGRGVAAVKNL